MELFQLAEIGDSKTPSLLYLLSGFVRYYHYHHNCLDPISSTIHPLDNSIMHAI